MREIVNASLVAMGARFEALYKSGGRPSIPPERLLRAPLLRTLYTLRSERQLVERLEKGEAVFVFGMAAYVIVRLPKLLAATSDVCPEGGK
jgi:hypothetical protein